MPSTVNHFTPMFVNLFVRWHHQLSAWLQNWSHFYLWPHYTDLWPFNL